MVGRFDYNQIRAMWRGDDSFFPRSLVEYLVNLNLGLFEKELP